MDWTSMVNKTQKLVIENSTSILTAVGVTGTVTTAILTGRASFKAAQILEWEQVDKYGLDFREREVGMEVKEKAKMVWPLYIPAAGVGMTTITAIIFCNRISSRRTAALAAAYGISERAFSEYKEKVVERLGKTKELAMRDEIAQDKVNKNPIEGREVIIAGSGDVLCYDSLTGRYFQSTIETIKKAENKVNYNIIHHMYDSLSSFYDEIGLPSTEYSEEVGWNLNNILDVTYSTTMSTDGRPCIVIDFKVSPVRDYGKLY